MVRKIPADLRPFILELCGSFQAFHDLPLTGQGNMLKEAARMRDSASIGTPGQEFSRVDEGLGSRTGYRERHTFTRIRDLDVTVECFLGECIKIWKALKKEFGAERTITSYMFYFSTDDNNMRPYSLAAKDIEELGVEECINQLLLFENDMEHKLFDNGSSKDVNVELKNYYLWTSAFTMYSRANNMDVVENEETMEEAITKEYEVDLPRESRWIKKRLANATSVRYLGFDFETVIDRGHSYVRPYALCVMVYDENGVELKRYTLVMDNHTALLAKFAEIIRKEKPKNKDENVYMIGFNNANFDNFMLHQTAIQFGLSHSSPFIVRNALLGINVEGIMVKDLFRFVMDSLKNACESFDCSEIKGELNHAKVQTAYYKGPVYFKKYLAKNKSEIVEYVQQDVISMMRLWFDCKREYKKTTGLDMEDYMTLASVSYASYQLKAPEGVWKDKPEVNAESEEFIRMATCAGRSQVFIQGKIEEEVVQGDVKSLYPHLMKVGLYPVGQEIKTKKYVKGKIGIYKIKVLSQPKIKIIAKKGDSGWDWAYEGKFTTHVSNVTLECMDRHGGKYEVLHGIYWEKSTHVFGEFVDDLYAHKKEQDELKKLDKNRKPGEPKRHNPALRNIVKLLLNSLSGKMIQKTYTTRTCIVESDKQMKDFEKMIQGEPLILRQGITTYMSGTLKEEYVKRNIPIVWGVLIYEYSRTYMYDNIYSKMEGLIATETDSYTAIKTEAKKHIKKYKNLYGDEMGQLEVEYMKEKAKAVVVSKKCMVIYDYKKLKDYNRMMKKNLFKRYKDQREMEMEIMFKKTFKGVKISKDKKDKIGGDKIISKEEYDKLRTMTEKKKEGLDKYKHALYHDKSLGSHVHTNTFMDLVDNKTVRIICSQLTRKLKPDPNIEPIAYIKQIFTIKSFPQDLKKRKDKNIIESLEETCEPKDDEYYVSSGESDSDLDETDEAEESDAPIHERDEDKYPMFDDDYVYDDYAPVQEREMGDYKYPVFDDDDDYPSGDDCSVDIPMHADVQDYSDYDSDYQEKMSGYM